jgi:hypothetical protein
MLKNIHQDVTAKAGLIRELEASGGVEHAEEIRALREGVRARARALSSLLAEVRALESRKDHP